jgi:hypothetical protein
MTVIELPDEQAAALKAKAAADGLTLEAWPNKLAGIEASIEQQPADRPRRHIADVIIENMRKVPPEIMAAMPTDGASQHDHYIYGWPKKEAWPLFSLIRFTGFSWRIFPIVLTNGR